MEDFIEGFLEVNRVGSIGIFWCRLVVMSCRSSANLNNFGVGGAEGKVEGRRGSIQGVEEAEERREKKLRRERGGSTGRKGKEKINVGAGKGRKR